MYVNPKRKVEETVKMFELLHKDLITNQDCSKIVANGDLNIDIE